MTDGNARRLWPTSLLGRMFRESLGAAREMKREKTTALADEARTASPIDPVPNVGSAAIDTADDTLDRRNSEPLLDPDHRAMLEEEFGPSMLVELTLQFRTDAIELVEQIEAAVSGGDVAALRVAAHTLRGAAENLGCVSLARAVVDLKDRYVEFGLEAATMPRVDLRFLLAETLSALEPAPR